jgi:hypothetical protein
MNLSRRNVVSGASMAALVTLSGCGGDTLASLTGSSTTAQAPLKIAAGRALTALGSAGGFAGSAAAKISLPVQLAGQSGGSIFGASLTESTYRAKLVATVNAVAEAAIPAAKALIENGAATYAAASGPGPYPGTDALQRAIGASLLAPVSAAIEARLNGPDGVVVDEALAQVIGIDKAGFTADVAQRAIAGIFAAIGVEEAGILGNELPA